MNKVLCLLILALFVGTGSRCAFSDEYYKSIPERAKEAYESGETVFHVDSPIIMFSDSGATISQLLEKYDLLLITPVGGGDSYQSVYLPESDLITTFAKYKVVERISTPGKPELLQDSPVPPVALIPQSDEEILLSFNGGVMCADENGNLSRGVGCQFLAVFMHPRIYNDTSTSFQYLVFVERSAQYQNTGLVIGGWESALQVKLGKLVALDNSYLASQLAGKTLNEVRNIVQAGGSITPASLRCNVLKSKVKGSSKKSAKKLRKEKKKKKRGVRKAKRKTTSATVAPTPTPTHAPIIPCIRDHTIPKPKEGGTVRYNRLGKDVPQYTLQISSEFDNIPGNTNPDFYNLITNPDPSRVPPAVIQTFDPNLGDQYDIRFPISLKLDQATKKPDIIIRLLPDSVVNGGCAHIDSDENRTVIAISESNYYNNIKSNPGNLLATILHELGHFMGLYNTNLAYDDPDSVPSLMNNFTWAPNDKKSGPGSRCTATGHEKTFTVRDKLTIYFIQDPKMKSDMCKEGKTAKPPLPNSGGGNGGGGGGGACDPANENATCYGPDGDNGAYCVVSDGCGIFTGITRCTHNGGGEWDCGKWGIVNFPNPLQ